jgi:hypothetical protein
MSSEVSQEKLVKLMLKASSMNAKQLESLLKLADKVSRSELKEKGFRFSEFSYIYLIPSGYYYARVNLPLLIPGFKVADSASRYYCKCLGKVDLESAKKACWQLEADIRADEKHGALAPNAHSSTSALLSLFMNRYKARTGKKRTTAAEYLKCLKENLWPAVLKIGPISLLLK